MNYEDVTAVNQALFHYVAGDTSLFCAFVRSRVEAQVNAVEFAKGAEFDGDAKITEQHILDIAKSVDVRLCNNHRNEIDNDVEVFLAAICDYGGGVPGDMEFRFNFLSAIVSATPGLEIG